MLSVVLVADSERETERESERETELYFMTRCETPEGFRVLHGQPPPLPSHRVRISVHIERVSK